MFLNHPLNVAASGKKTHFALVSPPAALTLILLAFSFSVFAAAAGDLDRSFGQDGIAIPNGFPGSYEGHAIAVQPDGKIVVAGIAHAPPYGLWGFALVRYLPNGALDPSFGANGQVLTPTTTTGSGTSFSSVRDVAVTPDGKIIVAGSVRIPDNTTGFSRQALAVLRYNADGSVDTTFHDNGKYIRPSGIEASAVKIAVQPDGRFVVAGYGGGALKATVPYYALLLRFAGNSLDPAFHNGATAIPNGETQPLPGGAGFRLEIF